MLLFAHACAKIYNIRYWKKNGSRILVLDRSESVFALLKLFSGYGSVYLFLWTGYLIYKSDDSFWNWNYEKEIFEIVSFILCSWSSRRYYFAVIDRVTFIIIYYVSYYQRILEELNEKYFWINFMLHGKKHEILRGYYWESNMRAKVNQFTYNVPIYPASKLLIRLLSV